MSLFTKKKKGFTIVELVIVVAVIAVLSAILIPTFVGLVNKAHIAADDSLVRDLNNALAIDREVNGEHKTMSEALKITDEYGFNVQRINAKANKSEILWDSVNDVFCYFDGQTNEITYIPETKLKTPSNQVKDYQYFVIKKGVASSSDLSDKYSTYLYQSTATNLTTTKGLDVGEETNVTSVTYNGGTSARDIVIRTNSITTSLTINGYVDSSNNTLGDVVYHYGVAGTLNVIKCATGSYHENGKVGFAEIKTGRIVLEPKSEVEHIHINSNGSNAFDEVVIKDNGTQKTPETITRDAVEVSSATLVVTVESVSGAQEEVYVYASGTSGTTEKTTTQNKDVNSTLGKLVLDNGTTSKALNENEKEEAKDEAASEAVSADFEQDPANANYVARIGQTGYLTLDAAINAAKTSENPATVSLLKDIQTTSSFSITRSMTIKGSNHTITAAGTGSGYLFTVQDDNSTPSSMIFNISDLKLVVTGRQCVVLVNNANDDYSHTFNISNADITTDGEAVYSNGANVSNIIDSTIRHEGTYATGKDAVYYTALIVGYKGTLNATRCSITSFGNGVGAFPSGGTINLNDCEILAADDYVTENAGYSIYVWHQQNGYDNGTYKDYVGDSIINVYSGTYNGPLKYRFEPVNTPDPTITYYDAELNIYGGTFNDNPTTFVVEGHTVTENSNGTWTVK